MKKLFRTLLCAAGATALLCAPAFAEEPGPSVSPAPEEAAFYLMVNGDYAAIPGDLPQCRDGRTFLPYEEAFTAMGVDAAVLSAEDGTVVSGGDVTVTLTVGETAMTVIREGETRTAEIDAAPYMDGEKLYIPVGPVASALGYRAAWDGSAKTVVLDDVDAILAANTETYALMDQYMAFAAQFNQGNWRQAGDFSLGMDMGSLSKEGGLASALGVRLSAAGNYDALTAGGSALQMDMGLTMNGVPTINGVEASNLAAMLMPEGMSRFSMDLDLEMRGDLESGKLYYHSKALNDLMAEASGAPAEDVWHVIDLKGMWDGMGLDYAGLIGLSRAGSSVTFTEYLGQTLRTVPLSSGMTTRDWLRELNAYYGDSGFVWNGQEYVKTLDDLGGGLGNMELAIYTDDGGNVNGMGETFRVEMEGVTALMTVAHRNMAVECVLTAETADYESGSTLAMEMTLTGTYAPTDAAPAVEPPAGAKVVDDLAGLGVIGGADGPTSIVVAP